ncbi:hypothetical protein [Parageobacillus thermoglucosidasius]|uniref:Uncharacterized protein n=1 Tax=Parageobacillus thermoglucosidasius TaxID=1426 RepID=A0A1B7KP94_PARTM|nr:hypothetical protein [Parageobacillus thermoglucosidasius]OAT71892.1 hypothetical protein A7K69_10805 [Parageobacillus thermoglucosidasius]
MKFKEIFFRSVLPVIIAFILYCTIGFIFIILLKSIFFKLAKLTVLYNLSTNLMIIVFGIIILIFMFIYLKIAFHFYRLKENQNTKFLYGIFEIILGLFIMTIFSLSFLSDFSATPSVLGIDLKVILGFYGGIYVIVRGLENWKKHFEYHEKSPVIFLKLNRKKSIEINLDRKTFIEKFFERMLKF